MSIKNEVILITGASSGLGRALAEKLAADNAVIACARNTDKLDELSKTHERLQWQQFDVTDRDLVDDLQSRLLENHSCIDRVILNAGDCLYLEPGDLSLTTFDAMMAVNFFGWINTLNACKPLLKSASRPQVVGICSQVIFAPFSRAAAYGASKAAADYLLQSFAMDNRDIDVSLIYPGFIDTPLTRKNDFPMPFLMNVNEACNRTLKAIEKRQPRATFPHRLRLLLGFSIFHKMWLKKMGHQH